MKHFLLVIVVFLLSFCVNAQDSESYATQRGSLSLTGGLSFSSLGGDRYENNDGDRRTIINFNPGISVFVVPSLALGMDASIYMGMQGDYTDTEFGVGPKITYYIAGHRKMKAYPFIEFSGIYYSGTDEYLSGSEIKSNTYNELDINGGMGLMVMLGSHTGMTVALKYETNTYTYADNDARKGNLISFAFGFRSFIFKNN